MSQKNNANGNAVLDEIEASAERAQTVADGYPITLRGATLELALLFAAEDEDKHSVEYCVEDALVRGITAIRNSRKQVAKNKNRRDFDEELAKNPAILADPAKFTALVRKYGIGEKR